jgi:hypothetical protein
VNGPDFRGTRPIPEEPLPRFRHNLLMGQLVFMPPRTATTRPLEEREKPRGNDPGAAARGVLMALALSCLVWIALAIAVPRLW